MLAYQVGTQDATILLERAKHPPLFSTDMRWAYPSEDFLQKALLWAYKEYDSKRGQAMRLRAKSDIAHLSSVHVRRILLKLLRQSAARGSSNS